MTQKKQAPRLIEVVEQVHKPQQRATWTDVLPEAARQELLETRRKHQAGELNVPKKTLAKSIVKWSVEIGCPIQASEVTIAAWLRQTD